MDITAKIALRIITEKISLQEKKRIAKERVREARQRMREAEKIMMDFGRESFIKMMGK